MRKAQGATEYLIILAVVVVIALILIGVLGGIPGIGGGAGSRTTAAYWSTQDVAITDSAMSASGTDSIVLKNNLKDTVTVTAATINGVQVSSGSDTIAPGSTVKLSGAIGACTAGQQFSYTVSITYTDTATGASYTETGDGNNLEGKCAA